MGMAHEGIAWEHACVGKGMRGPGRTDGQLRTIIGQRPNARPEHSLIGPHATRGRNPWIIGQKPHGKKKALPVTVECPLQKT